jgi:hypothetical protein
MSKRVWTLLSVLVLLVGVLAGCGSTPVPTQAPEPTTPPAAEAALRMTGPAQEIAWTEDDLKAMDTLEVDYTDKDGVVTTYTGVLITNLLKEGGVTGTPDLALVAGDGYAYDLIAADYQDCTDCIVAFDPAGGLRSVLPALGGKAQVKDLAEIQVKGSAAPAEMPAGGIPEGAALKITGNVNQEIGWLEEDVRAMETMEAESTNKAGETSTYTGVSINKLLEMAGPASDATTVVYVADDGYTAEVTLAEVQGCADCIVSFRNQGGFSIVMPGFPSNLQVKGVIEIQVK